MSNQEQFEYWNGVVGEKWRQMHHDTEAMLRPFTDALLKRATPSDGKMLLDIGCGAGETTILAANKGADALGVDISEPLISAAKSRTDIQSNNARFEIADASVFKSETQFDIAISRFGIMFFDNPVLAFKNIFDLIRNGGSVYFVCWQSAEVNDWVQVPMRALKGLVEETTNDPYAPGPFAFADKERLEGILVSAGFKDVEIKPLNAQMSMATGKGIDGALEFMLKIGPASRAISELNSELREIAIKRLKQEISKHIDADTVKLEGKVWLVSAIK